MKVNEVDQENRVLSLKSLINKCFRQNINILKTRI